MTHRGQQRRPSPTPVPAPIPVAAVFTACAAVGLGTLFNGAVTATTQRGSLFATLGGIAPATAPVVAFIATVLVTVAALAALHSSIRRTWPWLLLAGTVVALPGALAELDSSLADGEVAAQVLFVAGVAGPLLVLLAVLGAGSWLAGIGAPRAGAVLVGATFGVQLLGAGVLGAGWLASPADPSYLYAGLALLAVVAAVSAVSLQRAMTRNSALRAAAGNSASSEQPPERGPGLRLTIAGCVAALLPLISHLLTNDTVSGLLGVSADSLVRRPYVLVVIAGVITLVAAVAVAAIGGGWAIGGALAAASVTVGLSTPLTLATAAVSVHPWLLWLGCVVGLLLGLAAAWTPWRGWLAIGGCALSALALVVASVATGGATEKVVTQSAVVPATLLLALVVATGTAGIATVGAALTGSAALPVVLGPLTSGLVLGGGQALVLTRSDGDSSYLSALRDMGVPAGLLVLAAVLLTCLALARRLRPAKPGEQADPVTEQPALNTAGQSS